MPKFLQPISNRIATFAIILALVAARVRAADDAPHAVKIRIDQQAIVAHIPDDFIGFGYETSAVAQPDFFSPKNARMIQLYRNLGPHGLIRIGGNVSDHTRYMPDGTAAVHSERDVTIINQTNLADLGEFARATGWPVMWGLNLRTGSKQEAVEEAMAVDKALGSGLQSFEIGNEVDLMRRYANHYDQYHAAFLDYKAAIRDRLPRAAFSGPDSAGSLSWVEQFVATEAGDMKYATHHYYRGGASDPNSTIERLLTRDDGFDHRLDQLRKLSTDHKIAYRINEVNSFYGGGKAGVSDTFASALWCLDYMFDVGTGCGGVNMETNINQHAFVSHYSPIVHDTAGICTAGPEYYGMLAFAIAAHGDVLKTDLTKDDINLTAYATRDGQEPVWITIISKDRIHDAAVEISLPAGYATATCLRLRAPSLDSKGDVTLGGAAVADDGSWTPRPADQISVTDGIGHITMPHATAALVKLLPQ